MKPRLAPLLLALILGSAPAAPASMISLAYSGADDDDPYITSLGSGGFTFANGSTSLTLANLTSFQFSQRTTIADPSLSGAATFTYGLGDLQSFSASLSATGAIIALSFTTGYVRPTSSTFAPGDELAPEYFVMRSIRTDGASTYNGPHSYDELQIGTVVASVAVPEPSSLALCAVAGLTGFLARPRRGASSGREAGMSAG